MMKLNKLILVGGFASLICSCAEEAPKNNTVLEEKVEDTLEVSTTMYTVDSAKSNVRWIGSKPTEDHYGTISLISTELSVSANQVVDGSISIDMSSIVVEDIENPEYNAKLVGHLKSEDFFSVEKFPQARFDIKESINNKDGLMLIGDLAIKEKTAPVEIKYEATTEGENLMVKGDMTFDRTQYDIKYQSKTFFGDLGDKFIDDEVKIEFDLVLVRVADQ